MTRYMPPNDLTREELIQRLTAAEDLCLLFAWSPARSQDGTDPEKAAHEVWATWAQLPGVSCDPKDHPEWTKARIAELAARRDRTRAETLSRIRGESHG